MAKASHTERAQRINAALALRQKYGSSAQAATMLATEYGISKRQAYRYVQEAEAAGKQIPVPEQKVVFTVKLPPGLISQLHTRAQLTGQTLSDLVAQALRTFLAKRRGRG